MRLVFLALCYSLIAGDMTLLLAELINRQKHAVLDLN